MKKTGAGERLGGRAWGATSPWSNKRKLSQQTYCSRVTGWPSHTSHFLTPLSLDNRQQTTQLLLQKCERACQTGCHAYPITYLAYHMLKWNSIAVCTAASNQTSGTTAVVPVELHTSACMNSLLYGTVCMVYCSAYYCCIYCMSIQAIEPLAILKSDPTCCQVREESFGKIQTKEDYYNSIPTIRPRILTYCFRSLMTGNHGVADTTTVVYRTCMFLYCRRT